jgi:hypothetical protein
MDHTQPNPYPFGMGHGDWSTVSESAGYDRGLKAGQKLTASGQAAIDACRRITEIIEIANARAVSEGTVILKTMTHSEMAEVLAVARSIG